MKDKEIVIQAVQNHGSSLEYANDNLKEDKEIVLKAVQQDRYALEFADEKLHNNNRSLWSQENI